MELEITISDVLKVDEDGFICCSGRDYMKQLRPHQQEKGLAVLSRIINTLGERSAIAQKLKQIITTTIKFYGTDQRIYIKVAGSKAMGFVKVGEKKLFYHDMTGSIKELYPTAVLDIYVHETCQRTGIGKEVFQKFIKSEVKAPQKLAYDRPSQKLISFLKKHYSLSAFIPQNNNFVIFDRFFQKGDKLEKQQKTEKQDKIEKHQKTRFIESSNSRQRKDNILEKVSMNSGKFQYEQEDSLNKLAREMNGIAFQQATSFKETKDQSKSSFGCPWAVDQKLGFRTTSHTYGNYYMRR